ncbi:MAG: YCF48-related protein, partial [Ignavibacteriaceae bacterium]|nr:YCF48-related protein [Ignavibacteriaceae bacterium]
MKAKISVTVLFSFFLFSNVTLTQPQWYEQDSGGNRELTDVCFVDQNNGWISGWTGTMLHTTDGGATWTPQNILPNNAYWSVFFTDLLNGWATGYAGKIVHTTDGGETWVDQTSPENTELYESYFINPDIGWIVGGDTGGFPSYISHRIILYTSNGGDTWIEQYGEAYKAPLSGVFFPDQNIGYASGQYGLVMKTTDGGTTWLEDTIFTYFDFDDIFFLNGTTGWVVGEYLDTPHYAAIFKTTDGGINWIETQLGYDESLSSIYFVDNMKGWAVGGANSQGLVYYTSDGGANWIQQNIPSTEYLYKVFFVNENYGWASGHLGSIISTVNPVPVELTSFTAKANKNSVILNWQTSTETNNSGFEVQRKIGEWESMGFVEGHGTTTEEKIYSFVDENLVAGTYQYRLKQIDYDGSFEYSEIANAQVLSPKEYN